MAFHDQFSPAMYTDHHLTGNILPEHLNHTSPEVKSGPPTWLNNAILRQQNHHYTGEKSLVSPPDHDDDSMFVTKNENQERKLHQMSEFVNDMSDSGDWQNAKCKADVVSHPLYDQLLSAHVSCLRIATPVDQLPRIDAQLAQARVNVQKYVVLEDNSNQPLDDKDLDQFMVKKINLTD